MQRPGFPKQCSFFLFFFCFDVATDLRIPGIATLQFQCFSRSCDRSWGIVPGRLKLPLWISFCSDGVFWGQTLSTAAANESTMLFSLSWASVQTQDLNHLGKKLFLEKTINPFVTKMKSYQPFFYSYFSCCTNETGFWKGRNEMKLTTYFRTNQGPF